MYSNIAANFSRHAKSYECVAHAQRLAAERLAARISRQSEKSLLGNILEVGCGTGLLSKQLLQLFSQKTIYFLDPAENMLALCRENLQESSACYFIHSTIEDYFDNPQYSFSKYSLIASSFVLQWLFDLKPVLNRLIDQLAPSGQLFFSLPITGSFPQWQKICGQLNLPFTGNRLPGLEDIEKAIDNSKAIIDYEEYTHDVEFKNSLQFFQHIKMLGANTKNFIPTGQLSIADFRRLLKALDTQCQGALGKGDKKLICTYKILEGTITRR